MASFVHAQNSVNHRLEEAHTSYKPSLASPRTMLEAEAGLAEAQLTVLQLRQNMIYQQFTNGLCAGGDVDD